MELGALPDQNARVLVTVGIVMVVVFEAGKARVAVAFVPVTAKVIPLASVTVAAVPPVGVKTMLAQLTVVPEQVKVPVEVGRAAGVPGEPLAEQTRSWPIRVNGLVIPDGEAQDNVPDPLFDRNPEALVSDPSVVSRV